MGHAPFRFPTLRASRATGEHRCTVRRIETAGIRVADVVRGEIDGHSHRQHGAAHVAGEPLRLLTLRDSVLLAEQLPFRCDGRAVSHEQSLIQCFADSEVDELRALPHFLDEVAEHLSGVDINPDPERIRLPLWRRELHRPTMASSELGDLHIPYGLGEIVAGPFGRGAAMQQELTGTEIDHTVGQADKRAIRAAGKIPCPNTITDENGVSVDVLDTDLVAVPPDPASVPRHHHHRRLPTVGKSTRERPSSTLDADLLNRPTERNVRSGGQSREHFNPRRQAAA